MLLESVRDLKHALSTAIAEKAMAEEAIDLPMLAQARALSAHMHTGRRRHHAAPSRVGPHAVSLGVAPTGRGFRLAVRVYERDAVDGPEVERIRVAASGEVDVRYVGRITKQAHHVPWNRLRVRPLEIGSSVGHFRVTAGTLGCFVRSRNGSPVLALSNNHVLADEDRGKKGDAIIQPGPADGGSDLTDCIGMLANYEPVRKADGPTYVDCAVAALGEGIDCDPAMIRGIGRLQGLGPRMRKRGDLVRKLGRTSGVTRGRVAAFELDGVRVAMEFGTQYFDDQIEIEGLDGPFSEAGDSGAIIVDQDYQAVGLLFAGSFAGHRRGDGGLSYANPMDRIMNSLNVNLVLA